METKIDLTKLSQEVQDYIKELQSDTDRRINAVMQKTRQEAMEALKADPNFVANVQKDIRAQIELEAKMTAEDKQKAILEKAELALKNARVRENTALAREEFSKKGITKDEYEDFMSMLVDEDDAKTIEKVNKWSEMFQKSVNAKLEQEKAKIKKNEVIPEKNGNTNVKSTNIEDYTMVQLNTMMKEEPERYRQIVDNSRNRRQSPFKIQQTIK